MGKVPDLFKRPSNLASLRPAAIQQHVQLHQQQISAHSATVDEPQLLQRLHACLDKAAIQEALSHPKQQQSTTKQQTRRQLNAYHEVFELLLASLTTYRCDGSYVQEAYGLHAMLLPSRLGNGNTGYCVSSQHPCTLRSPTVPSSQAIALPGTACCIASRVLHSATAAANCAGHDACVLVQAAAAAHQACV
jgi:hypothetical protein